MNSEELEQSLRAEFETYLKGVLAKMREEVTEFQNKIETEFEKHKSQIDEAFNGFSARFDGEHEFDSAFREAVVEHLRLARDEGAKITATAMSEAEDLERATNPEVSLSDIKDALNEISSMDSQSAILKSLIHHAAKYTPRGAFFIIKNEQFVGWKVFGVEAGDGESRIRDIEIPVAADTVLCAAVNSQSVAEGAFGSYSEDDSFLGPLEFGSPDRMYAIPLVARGRGVAVLYADYGQEGVTVNTDALEMLVRVAGLTVEMLAAAKAVHVGTEAESPSDVAETGHDVDDRQAEPDSQFAYSEPVEEVSPGADETVEDEAFSDYSYTPGTDVADETVADEAFSDYAYTPDTDVVEEHLTEPEQAEAESAPTFETAEFESTQPIVDYSSESETPVDEEAISDEVSSFEPVTAEDEEPDEDEAAFSEPVTEPAIAFEDEEPVHSFEPSPFDRPVEKFEPAGMIGGGGVSTSSSPMVETISSTAKATRLSDRHVDLPIEVAEDERRLHNDARRFARLLVSEIKLYNEKKVQDGREANDLYERLREAIDRSREMYDKRVQPPVASKFDYFHYELVNSLAEGDDARLGPGYPGSTI